MDHRADAATQVFGQIHELGDALQRRVAAHSWEPLQHHPPWRSCGLVVEKRTTVSILCGVAEGV